MNMNEPGITHVDKFKIHTKLGYKLTCLRYTWWKYQYYILDEPSVSDYVFDTIERVLTDYESLHKTKYKHSATHVVGWHDSLLWSMKLYIRYQQYIRYIDGQNNENTLKLLENIAKSLKLSATLACK